MDTGMKSGPTLLKRLRTAVGAGREGAVFGLILQATMQNPRMAAALGVLPSTRDVVGPIARCVRDAALTLDALAGFSSEDPKTVAGIGHRPNGGYTSRLAPDALRGKRLGLYGPGWRDRPLSDEAASLYRRAQDELRGRGAELVEDPFAGSGFAAIGRPATRLDGLVFPQMRDDLPPLHGPATLHETTVCEINIAGLPGVTLPAGAYASGAPFNLIFVGRLWSEADLLAFAFDYESATQHRRAPTLAEP